MARSNKALVQKANQEGFALELKDRDWRAFDMPTVSQEDLDHVLPVIRGFLITKTRSEIADMAVRGEFFVFPFGGTGLA